MEPSIKGVVIAKLVEDAQRLHQQSDEFRERIEAELSPGTLTLLEEKPGIGSWYPIDQYRELAEVLWREEGGGRVEYLHERGAAAVKRLMDAGLYQQLSYLDRTAEDHSAMPTRQQILTSTKLVGSIMGTILNFSKHDWHFDPRNTGHLLHEITEAAAYPEVLRFVQAGAETYLLRLGRPDAPEVSSVRPAPDRIVFTSDYTGAFDPDS